MAKGSVDVLKDKIDVSRVIEMLNMALAEEWLAFYQYWTGAQVIKGVMRAEVQSEFMEHAMEEYKHAQMLATRIIELEGTPILSPTQWSSLAECKYDAPIDPNVITVLKQNVISERCAIYRYQRIVEYTHGKDYTTCDIAKAIMQEEEEHEQELQDYIDDFDEMSNMHHPSKVEA